MERQQRTKWVENKDCVLCKRFIKAGWSKLGDILVKKSPDGKRHRHLTRKELEKISQEYQNKIFKDSEEIEKQERAAMVEARQRGVFDRRYR